MIKIPRFQNPPGNPYDRAQPIPPSKRVAIAPFRLPDRAKAVALRRDVETWVNEGGAGGEWVDPRRRWLHRES